MTTEIEVTPTSVTKDTDLPSAGQLRIVYADHEVKDFSDGAYQTLITLCEKVLFSTNFAYEDGKLGTAFLAQFPKDWNPPVQTKGEDLPHPEPQLNPS